MRGIRHEKNFVMFTILFVLLFGISGCCSCGRINTDAADVIAGDSRAVGRLEATVEALDGTVVDSRKRIADIIETSRNITDGVERVEYLFGEYESEIERILNEIDRIRNEAELPGEDNQNSNNNSDSIYNSSGNTSNSKD